MFTESTTTSARVANEPTPLLIVGTTPLSSVCQLAATLASTSLTMSLPQPCRPSQSARSAAALLS